MSIALGHFPADWDHSWLKAQSKLLDLFYWNFSDTSDAWVTQDWFPSLIIGLAIVQKVFHLTEGIAAGTLAKLMLFYSWLVDMALASNVSMSLFTGFGTLGHEPNLRHCFFPTRWLLKRPKRLCLLVTQCYHWPWHWHSGIVHLQCWFMCRPDWIEDWVHRPNECTNWERNLGSVQTIGWQVGVDLDWVLDFQMEKGKYWLPGLLQTILTLTQQWVHLSKVHLARANVIAGFDDHFPRQQTKCSMTWLQLSLSICHCQCLCKGKGLTSLVIIIWN